MLSHLLEKDRVLRINVMTAAVFYGGILFSVLLSTDFTNIMGQHLGGDFMAFYGASQAVLAGEALQAYDVAWFEAQLQGVGPAIEFYGLTWQYPPSYFLFIAPLALLPYKLSYLLWLLAGFVFMAGCLRLLPIGRYGLLLAIASPMLLTAAVQGQNSFFIGGLFILAASQAKTRPLLAGVAAALLTIKPQLGVLIPIAYLAAGCWRAFFVAAVLSVLLAMVSTFLFGVSGWLAFIESLGRVTGDLAAGGHLYPYARMLSPYSAFGLAGVPHDLAMLLHWCFAAGLVALVAVVWRRSDDMLLRGGLLVCAGLLVPPYAYYYEMTAMLLPFAALLLAVQADGWRMGEKAFFLLTWPCLLLLPTIQPLLPVQIGFVAVLCTLFLILLRIEEINLSIPLRSADLRA
ncbi:glycosyltransferase family 87 protein [Parvularcula sp. IMCC14364]|uniref:glycosyltransferase family 87 protein n=1 Tax=Parvularcula sp. IMCC14364 TaxID=3067902 RepID=UPI00274121A4|nr:glycosyltransferase family 87 protein [Parvularcula sp. IMCC14364]